MKNILLVLSIVLVISIAICGSFGNQAKANPEWVEYRNEEYRKIVKPWHNQSRSQYFEIADLAC